MRFLSFGRRCQDIISVVLLCYLTYNIAGYAASYSSFDSTLSHGENNDGHLRRPLKFEVKNKEYFEMNRVKAVQGDNGIGLSSDEYGRDNYNCSQKWQSNCLDVFPSVLLYPKAVCSVKTDLVTLLTSRPERSNQRQAIRKSWARHQLIGMGEYKTVTLFVVGSNDPTEQESIEEENSHHSDVILGNFTDNGLYETMALIVGHLWVKRRCAEAQNVMKADDKTFINLEIMLPLVSKYLTHGVVMGYCKEKMAVSHMGNILDSKEESSPSCYAAGHVTTGLTASSITDMMKWVPVLPSR